MPHGIGSAQQDVEQHYRCTKGHEPYGVSAHAVRLRLGCSIEEERKSAGERHRLGAQPAAHGAEYNALQRYEKTPTWATAVPLGANRTIRSNRTICRMSTTRKSTKIFYATSRFHAGKNIYFCSHESEGHHIFHFLVGQLANALCLPCNGFAVGESPAMKLP